MDLSNGFDAGSGFEPKRILTPKAVELFENRSARFRCLAEGNGALSGFLRLWAEVAGIQRKLAEEIIAGPKAALLVESLSAHEDAPEESQARANTVEIRNPLPPGEGRVRAEIHDQSTSSRHASKALALTPSGFAPLASLSPEGEGLYSTTLPSRAPLDVSASPRLGLWRDVLRRIVRELSSDQALIERTLHRLGEADNEELDRWAGHWLAMDFAGIDSGMTPFLGAALQVQWTLLAERIDAAALERGALGYSCPVCGHPPVAGILQSGGTVAGLRYLSCCLCGSQWNRTRIRCVNCESGGNIAYFEIEGGDGRVKAEACGDCNAYLKLINREKAPDGDPLADDIASLSLDLLMAEKGFDRIGLNPFMIAGE